MKQKSTCSQKQQENLIMDINVHPTTPLCNTTKRVTCPFFSNKLATGKSSTLELSNSFILFSTRCASSRFASPANQRVFGWLNVSSIRFWFRIYVWHCLAGCLPYSYIFIYIYIYIHIISYHVKFLFWHFNYCQRSSRAVSATAPVAAKILRTPLAMPQKRTARGVSHLRKAVRKRIYRSTIVLTMFFGIGRNPAWISRRLFPPAARNASLPKWLQRGFHRLSCWACWDMGGDPNWGPQILVTWSMKIIHLVAMGPHLGIISSVLGKHGLPSEALLGQAWNFSSFSNADLLRCSSTLSGVLSS